MDRQTWLEARRSGLGGTDAAAILGLSRYRTPIDVWEDKLGLAPERPQTAAMEWGLRLEDAIANAYATETGRSVRKVRMRRASHVRTFPMLGSIDRIATNPTVENARIVEIKTARSDDLLGDPDGPPEQRVPADWYVQGQHYAEITGLEVVDYAVLVGGSDLRIIEVPRDPAFGADLVAELGDWWNRYVVPKEQPPVTGGDLAFLARTYPRDAGGELVATPELAAVVDDLFATDAEIDRLGDVRAELRATIEAAMKDNARLVAPAGTISWKAHDRKSTAWQEIAGGLRSAIERYRANTVPRDPVFEAILSDGFGTTDLDEIEALFTRTSTARPFVAKPKKEAS